MIFLKLNINRIFIKFEKNWRISEIFLKIVMSWRKGDQNNYEKKNRYLIEDKNSIVVASPPPSPSPSSPLFHSLLSCMDLTLSFSLFLSPSPSLYLSFPLPLALSPSLFLSLALLLLLLHFLFLSFPLFHVPNFFNWS